MTHGRVSLVRLRPLAVLVSNGPGDPAAVTETVATLAALVGEVTHINLNDGSLEGFVHKDKQVIAVQFHPEASPEPHDAGYLFERFVSQTRDGKAISAEMLAH